MYRHRDGSRHDQLQELKQPSRIALGEMCGSSDDLRHIFWCEPDARHQPAHDISMLGQCPPLPRLIQRQTAQPKGRHEMRSQAKAVRVMVLLNVFFQRIGDQPLHGFIRIALRRDRGDDVSSTGNFIEGAALCRWAGVCCPDPYGGTDNEDEDGDGDRPQRSYASERLHVVKTSLY